MNNTSFASVKLVLRQQQKISGLLICLQSSNRREVRHLLHTLLYELGVGLLVLESYKMCWMQPPMISTSEGGALILAQSDLLEPKTTPEPDTCATKMLQPKSAGSLRPIFFLLENNPNNQPSKRAHHLALM